MPVHTPGRVLLHHIPLKFVRLKVGGGARKKVDAGIALIPFIDFLLVLVIFLLASFGKQAISQGQREGLVLPEGANVDMLEEAPIIAISQNVVMLGGERMADTRQLAESPTLDRIEQLVQALENMRRNWGILHPRQPFQGTVIIMADRGIDYRVVKKVMFSAAQAGYANISFAVNRGGGA